MPPTVPINHHRLGEKKKIAFSLLFCFLLTPENQTKFVRDPTWPCSIIPCWSMQGIPQPLTVGFDLLWTLCFAQGKRTGALQKTKGEKKKREKSKLSLQIFQLWNPFVQTFLQKLCRKTRFEVQKRTLSKESTRASSRIIQTAMTFKEEPLRSWQPEKRRRDQCETESKPDCIFCGKPFCFLRGDNLRRESVKRKKKKNNPATKVVLSFLSPRTRCPAGNKAQPATLFTDRTKSFPPRNPTTSFSTTAILAYAIGAGITAAAGTRLALQLFLAKAF